MNSKVNKTQRNNYDKNASRYNTQDNYHNYSNTSNEWNMIGESQNTKLKYIETLYNHTRFSVWILLWVLIKLIFIIFMVIIAPIICIHYIRYIIPIYTL